MKISGDKILTFFKRNAVYFVLAFCILAIGISAMFAIIHENNRLTEGGSSLDVDLETPPESDDKDSGVNEPVDSKVTFILPVESAKAITEYSETMVFNSTLSLYSAHKAVDFYADEGAPVYAVADGVVSAVESSVLKGYTVTIDHGNGLYTVYNSLADGDMVSVGQQVSQGDIIGEVSVSNRQEYKSGAHLHFEVIENGETIDPEAYLDLGNK